MYHNDLTIVFFIENHYQENLLLLNPVINSLPVLAVYSRIKQKNFRGNILETTAGNFAESLPEIFKMPLPWSNLISGVLKVEGINNLFIRWKRKRQIHYLFIINLFNTFEFSINGISETKINTKIAGILVSIFYFALKLFLKITL